MRPLNEREAANGKPGWRALPTYNAITQLDSKGEPVQGATYSMDNVFDTESNTKDLYSSVCMPVVANVVKGINGTIFAYGQTSSGKTFTMQGAQGADSGVLQLAAETIFAQIQATPDREFKLSASYLEIYNENLRDLLHDHKSGAPPSYAIKHDEAWGTVVANMGRVDVCVLAQVAGGRGPAAARST